MDRIYEQSKDLHVVAVKIYANDGKAYVDAAHTTQFKTSELKEAFIKGCIVIGEDSLSFPVGYAETEGVGGIAVIVPNSTTATSADIDTIVAVADDE
jgi:hypothetical protein